MEVITDIIMSFGEILGSAWAWFLNLFTSQAFSNVFSALLGAVVGSISGYVFNRQLEKTRTKERYLIQRKNTVYSPIYKELLALRAYLKEIDEHTKGRQISIQFDDRDNWRRGFNFHIWEDIKKDIRKTYITDEQRNGLNELTLQIESQLNLQDTIHKDTSKLAERFEADNKNYEKPIDKRYSWKPKDRISGILNEYLTGHNSAVKAKDELVKYFAEGYAFTDTDSEAIAKKILTKARRLNSYKSLRPSLLSLIETTDAILGLFDKTIRDIIKKYEGGLEVE